jgi:hypothetical protein
MFYAPWDLESRNLMDEYDTEAKALAAMRDVLDANARNYVRFLSLGRTEDDATTHIVAQGRPLAVMADRAFAERTDATITPTRLTRNLEPGARIYSLAQARPSRASKSRAARGPQVPAS